MGQMRMSKTPTHKNGFSPHALVVGGRGHGEGADPQVAWANGERRAHSSGRLLPNTICRQRRLLFALFACWGCPPFFHFTTTLSVPMLRAPTIAVGLRTHRAPPQPPPTPTHHHRDAGGRGRGGLCSLPFQPI